MARIDVYKDFSDTPGGRYKAEGEFSGELFRDEYLFPKLEESEKNSELLIINFDNCFGFATSFLEEAFGGLVRKYKKKGVFEQLVLLSEDDETIPDLIKKYIYAAEQEL